jgi:exodeoxyribonuclease VII small subunit
MPAKKAAQSTKKPTFAEARTRLDEILEALERDADDVDQLAARIKEASELIRHCRERLSSARHEVRDVVAELAAETQSGASTEAEAETFVPDEATGEDGDGEGTLPF